MKDKKKLIASWVIVPACLLMPCIVSGAENLISLYQKAEQYDAQYRYALANTEAEKEEMNKVRALFLPKVQLSASAGRGVTDRSTQLLSGATADAHFSYDVKSYALSVKQPLFNRENAATYRSAEANVKSKVEILRQENASLISRISSAYFELLYAKEQVTVTQSKIEAISQQLSQAKQRYEHGEGTIVEISEAQSDLDLADAELIGAQNSVSVASQELGNISGQPITDIAELNTDKLPSSMPYSESLDEWLDAAYEHNPDILAAFNTLEVARQEVEKRQAGHYPTLDLVGVRSYSENDSNNTIGAAYDSTTIALQLNMPLYSGGYVNASVSQAVDRVTAAEELLNSKKRDTSSSIHKYFNNLKSEVRSIQAYQQAVKSSQTALLGTQKAFAAGVRTNIEVLNAQQKLYSSKLDLSKAQYMLINDMVNIKQAAGLLNEAELHNFSRFFVID